MDRKLPKLLVFALAGFLCFAAPVSAATKHVNCDAGHSLGRAIETARGSASFLEITVSGYCDESVTIRRDDVSITGDPYAVINGTVRVFHSNNVSFSNVEITGPGDGLVVSGGGDVIANGVTIALNDGTGLVLRRSSQVWFRDGTIVGNCEAPDDESCSDGASVDGAALELTNVSIVNSRYGVIADTGARVILGTTGGAITEIAHNTVVGIQVSLHSVVDLRGNTQVHDNRYHGLFATQDSAIRIQHPSVNVSGNIGCLDEESSFDNSVGGTITSTDCSGF